MITFIIIYGIINYNALVRIRNRVRTNWAQIDVVLKRRADLILNMVATVKGYASHEKETLESVINARNRYLSSGPTEQQIANAGQLTSALDRLMVLTERYPDLKANTSFNDLQTTLRETEDKIQHARQAYNDSVYEYSNKIELFPSNIVASLGKFKPMPLFEVHEQDKEIPEMNF